MSQAHNEMVDDPKKGNNQYLVLAWIVSSTLLLWNTSKDIISISQS